MQTIVMISNNANNKGSNGRAERCSIMQTIVMTSNNANNKGSDGRAERCSIMQTIVITSNNANHAFNDLLYPQIHPAHTSPHIHRTYIPHIRRTYIAHTYPHMHQKCDKGSNGRAPTPQCGALWPLAPHNNNNNHYYYYY